MGETVAVRAKVASEKVRGSKGVSFFDDDHASKRQRKTRNRCCDVRARHFSELEERHPYGALPGGNSFFSGDKKKPQRQPISLLSNDECWINVLGFCDGRDLSKVVQTCKYFYVAGHQPELWRDLVLRKCNTEKRVLSEFRDGWKGTLLALEKAANCSHQPMAVSGVYSDTFYRLHSCRSFSIPKAWLDKPSNDDDRTPFDVARVPVEKLTEVAFKEEHEKPNTPLLIEGAAQSWRALEHWSQEYLLQHTQGRTFRATSGVAPLPCQFTFSSYLEYCRSCHLEEAPLYLFDRSALQPGSDLWKDYMLGLQKSCPFWNPDRYQSNGHDLFQLLGEGRRPDHTWLICGPRRSGSVFHIDPNATHAWNATVCGRKRWMFYPPGVTPPGVHPSDDGDQVTLPLSVGEWLFQFWDEHVARRQSAPPHERPLECTAFPGDVVFVPHGWWHMVINLDEWNLAITHNYVSDSNLSNIVKFLRTKVDQISGCRDRAESIKPEQLSTEFEAVLQKHVPMFWEESHNIKRWTCKAWKDRVAGNTTPTTCVMEQAKQDCSGGFSFSFL